MAKRKRTKLRCGECGQVPVAIKHTLISYMESELDSEGYLNGECIHSETAGTGKLYALCECGHMWRIKRSRSVSDFERLGEADNG
jgi:hypothetical protein